MLSWQAFCLTSKYFNTLGKMQMENICILIHNKIYWVFSFTEPYICFKEEYVNRVSTLTPNLEFNFVWILSCSWIYLFLPPSNVVIRQCLDTSYITSPHFTVPSSYCQAQPQLQLKLRLRLALIPLSPATQPTTCLFQWYIWMTLKTFMTIDSLIVS